MFDSVNFEMQGQIALVSLNRPAQINAFNVQMRDDLWDVMNALHEDDNVRVVILRGEGEKGFCAGADLTEFGTTPSRVIAREARDARDVWTRIRALPVPVIAVLHGYVIGSGVEMALCCDVRIASEDAVFSLPEVPLGMIPFAGGSQTLPRAVGRTRALDLLLTGRRGDASEALSMGLVHRTVSRDSLMDIAYEQAEAFLKLSPSALADAKKAVTQGADLPLQDGLRVERNLAAFALWNVTRLP